MVAHVLEMTQVLFNQYTHGWTKYYILKNGREQLDAHIYKSGGFTLRPELGLFWKMLKI